MIFWQQFLDVNKTTLPISALLIVLSFVLLDLPLISLIEIVLCCYMLKFGFTLFLRGVDIGVIPMGSAIGAEMPKRNSLLFIIGVVFLISFVVTVAEPDVNVFANLVCSIYSGIDKMALILSISLGVGVFLMIATLRILRHVSLRLLITIGYSVVILMAVLTPDTFMGIAFDAGGVTTGPMTIPVLLAIGIGISSVIKSDGNMDCFGMIGLASIGPIIMVLAYGLLADTSDLANNVMDTVSDTVSISLSHIFDEFLVSVKGVLEAVIPLYIIFVIFEKLFLKYSWKSFLEMSKGILIASLGMILFLTGVYAGFMPLSKALGQYLAGSDYGTIALMVGLALGLLTVMAEPAVQILGNQVEDASQGIIPKKLIITTMAIGVSLFVGVTMYLLCTQQMSIYYVLPFYVIAIVLVWFMDEDLVGITYDAGGVSTGPMSVAVIMTMYAGMSSVTYTGTDAVINSFGIVAMIALAPIISLSILGIIIKIKKQKIKSNTMEGKQ